VTIDHDAGEPVWQQMARIIRDMITSGEVPKGKLLPSVRTLAQRYEVSDGTVKHALAELRKEGLVETVNGRGVYVR
jgi:GntR family transcriptional regulator